jgi:hypothetical protein
MFFCGLYVFYPYDAPSIAFISLSLSFIFRKELIYAFFCFIITELFRESSFHILTFVGVWAFVDKYYPYKTRFAWLALFFLIFVLQYKVIRHFYPSPITSVVICQHFSGHKVKQILAAIRSPLATNSYWPN